jgi:phosphonate transport system substrate-binding protein
MTLIQLNKSYLVTKTNRILFHLFLLIVFGSNISLPQSPYNDTDKDINYFQVGFSANIFKGVYLKDATAAAKVLTEFFLKKYKRTWKVKPHEVFSNINELEIILKKQEFEVLVMHPSEYVQVEDLDLLEPIAISLRNGSPYDSYLLLAHKDSKLKKIEDLKGKSILISSQPGNKVELWVDYLLKQRKLERKEKFFSKLQFIDKPLATILPIFFKNEDACIVDESSYKTVIELNPQIGENLITMEVSQPLAIGLVTIRKSILNPQVKAEIKEAFLDLHKYVESRQYLTIFRIGKVIEFSKEYLRSTYALLEIEK